MNLHRTLFRLLLGRRLPVTSGTLRIAGVRGLRAHRPGPVGHPPHRRAKRTRRVVRAGFLPGQDRAFQLETILRVSRGTVAEMVGARGVPIDRVGAAGSGSRGAAAATTRNRVRGDSRRP